MMIGLVLVTLHTSYGQKDGETGTAPVSAAYTKTLVLRE